MEPPFKNVKNILSLQTTEIGCGLDLACGAHANQTVTD